MKIITIEKQFVKLVLFVATVLLMTACEKAVVEENNDTSSTKSTSKSGKVNITLRVADFKQFSYETLTPKFVNGTRTVVDIIDYCTHLNFVVYKDGKKIDSRSQIKGNNDFGETTMSLYAGNYQLLVLAHSSSHGSPTLTNPEKIQFTDDLGYSDTFYYYGNFEVTADKQDYEIRLTRASSKLCFIIEDEAPSEVTNVHFFYTGGSGTLNAVTGYATNVGSCQEKNASIIGYTSPIEFNVYTFLETDSAKLNLKVEACNSSKKVVCSREFTDIPMERNKVTILKGSFFAKDQTLNFTAETEWADTLHLSY